MTNYISALRFVDFLQEIVLGGSLVAALNELKSLAVAPMRPSTDERGLPAQITRLVGKRGYYSMSSPVSCQ